MGIKGLSKLLAEHAPGCSMERKFQSYLDRKIAIDASMHIYQYLMVVGRSGESQLTDENGQVTAHLIGVLSRTCRMLEAGIKPVYVFDGKPPTLKGGELAKRKDKRDQAEKDLEAARETGDKDAIEKAAKRTVRVSKEQNQEVMRLVKLLGVPVFEAPCEAEATCAAMCKAGLVHGAATEDMDTLTFACPRLIRNLMAPASQKKDIAEYDFDKVLKGLDLDYDQFIDLCILCGCDYTDSIFGIGPVKALQLIREYKNIETILENIKDKKIRRPRKLHVQRSQTVIQRTGSHRYE
jgi:flap endonuclease-1